MTTRSESSSLYSIDLKSEAGAEEILPNNTVWWKAENYTARPAHGTDSTRPCSYAPATPLARQETLTDLRRRVQTEIESWQGVFSTKTQEAKDADQYPGYPAQTLRERPSFALISGTAHYAKKRRGLLQQMGEAVSSCVRSSKKKAARTFTPEPMEILPSQANGEISWPCDARAIQPPKPAIVNHERRKEEPRPLQAIPRLLVKPRASITLHRSTVPNLNKALPPLPH